MTDDPTLRRRAERAFHTYLDRTRDGTVVDPDGFVAEQETEVRDELRRIFDDYETLRSSLGDAPTDVEPGRVLADFELRHELGRGGMGVVWEAEQRSLKRPVALKLLFPHHGLAPGSLERFLREGEAGARLRHRNIAAVHAVGEADGIHYIAQELVPGGYSLADRLMESTLADRRDAHERTPDEFRALAELFAKVADAVQAAHDAGVLHRDLKPSNVLLAEGDEPKVIDFGLARLQGTLGITRTDVLAGTPSYMSPEQAERSAHAVDHRTDVFSLGATFYEALTLERAFDGDTHHQVLEKVVRVDPPDPRALKSRVPRELAVICMKAIEKSPERRYPTMAAFADDLRRFLRHEPIEARPPGALVRGAKWARRHPVAASLIAAAVPVILLLGTLLARESRARAEAQRATELARTAERRATAARGEAIAERDRAAENARTARRREAYAHVQAAAYSLELGRGLDARLHLDACDEAERGFEWNHLALVSDPSLTVVRGVPDGLHAVSWVDGRAWLATAADDGRTIRIWTPDDGATAAELPLDGTGDVEALAVSADGARLAAARETLRVDVFDVASGSLRTTLPLDDEPV
ncbi:MAG: WD40 repeat domain-containing serine/threonine protein kinase, partial [Planctomycetota bacterium JB042]